MLIMASVIRVGQSKFVTVPIDEDSSERIMNCIQTVSELESKPPVHQIFLKDTKAAYSKMVAAQEGGSTGTTTSGPSSSTGELSQASLTLASVSYGYVSLTLILSVMATLFVF